MIFGFTDGKSWEEFVVWRIDAKEKSSGMEVARYTAYEWKVVL